ncbi:MAG TPA: ABC transporter substrate-binding protein [Brumimicrobium sp.]|nr:ABC transporter substrate-binding protein [Brumimicrobium sp.]
MKRSILVFNNLILIFSVLFGLTFCTTELGKKSTNLDNVLYLDTLENDFAEAFQIIYDQNDVKINIIDPSTKAIIQSYKVRKNSQAIYTSFTHDVNRVVAMSTTHVGMLRKLGLEDKIVGVSSFNYLCRPLNKTSVLEIGDMGMTDAESFLATTPDVILYSGFNLNSPVLNKLEQANLKTFLIYEWKETHPLGRAEWIKVFGVLFQKQKEANAVYEEIKSEYYSIMDKLKLAKHKPTVFAGAYFGDVFNVPAGESYMAQLFKDANIDYVYSQTEGTGSLSLSLEEVITNNKETEFWLNASAVSKEELLKQSQKFKLLNAVRTGKLYSYFEKTNCFWENSPIEPHKILEDFGKIFHPTLFEEQELNYYTILKD